MPPPNVPAYDPELAAVLAILPRSKPLSNETLAENRRNIALAGAPEVSLTDPAILHDEKSILLADGSSMVVSVLQSRNTKGKGRPAVYFIHGGGMVMGTRLLGISLTFEWIKQLDCVVITPEYRVAPEFPDPTPVEDCYAGLKWVSEHASALGIDSTNLVVAGQSGGGGLAAGVTLLARHRRGPFLRGQCLICPMLDDRMTTVSSQQFLDGGSWSGRNNIAAWNMILSGRRGAKDVSIYAAPARATDLSGLPPTWIDVGGAEVFRDENVTYASKLAECGVEVELHVWPGAWHAFDMVAPQAVLTKVCLKTRLAWMRRCVTANSPIMGKVPALL